jgi:2-methylcitrate dehydratase PrpD
VADLTGALAAYVADALEHPLPPAALEATKHHVLDTLASTVAGSRLPAGEAGAAYGRDHGRAGEAIVIATGDSLAPEFAALANGMAAHADETDDSHELSKSHPGCSIVPASLATAQAARPTGAAFLRAVALGYDVGPRVNMAAWPSFIDVREERRGTPGISGMFGSAAAAAALRGLDKSRVRVLLSYVAQQVGGMNTWKRDTEHVEKAYVLGGWPAFGALFALSLVDAGWSGVADVFDGDPGFLDIVGKDPDPRRLVEGLGTRFEIERTHIKLHAVGSPAQAPIQALLAVIESNGLSNGDIASVRVMLPAVLAHTVQRSRRMPNINLLYLLATVVADGAFTYEAAHDEERFERWRDSGGDGRIEVVPDSEMEPRRQAVVEVTTADGGLLDYRVDVVRGSPENPMSAAEVRSKATGLMAPVVGEERAAGIADAVEGLDGAPNLDGLMAQLGPSAD